MYELILLSTDGTVASDEAESHAIDLAAAHDAVFHVHYVVDENVVTAYSGDEYVDEAEGPEHGLEELGGSKCKVEARNDYSGTRSCVDRCACLYIGLVREPSLNSLQ